MSHGGIGRIIMRMIPMMPIGTTRSFFDAVTGLTLPSIREGVSTPYAGQDGPVNDGSVAALGEIYRAGAFLRSL